LNDQNAPTLIFFPPTTRVWRFTLTNFLPLLVSAIGKASSLPPSLSPEAELLQVLSLKPSTIISHSTRSQRTTSSLRGRFEIRCQESCCLPSASLTRSSFASVSSSACASAITGNSGVDEKPSSTGASTAWASAGAAGRLVQFRQLQRRLEAEAARALLARNGDGGEEGLLGGRGVLGTDLQQDVAANAMQEGVSPERRATRCPAQTHAQYLQQTVARPPHRRLRRDAISGLRRGWY
jgi:hypothetical protein